MPREKISITISPEVLAQIDSRGDERSGIISRDLDRYYESLRHARMRLREALGENETALLLDNLNGVWMHDTFPIRLMWVNVQDGIELESLDRKWEVNGPALVKKLQEFDFTMLLALADCAERWWNRVSADEQPNNYLSALGET